MPTLQTERLLLRPWEPGDFEAYAAIMADPEVVRYLGTLPLSREDAWRNLALLVGHGQLRGYTLNAVVERTTGRLLGRCGLWQPEGWPGLEVGWALGSFAWGQGFATEAAKLWRDYAFRVLGVEELVSLIHPSNERSQRVARRVGLRRLREVEVRGVTCQLWGQTRQEALARKKR
ncbi:MAG: GNAT family N-acetyltransferase [Myxococcaceae bacterium]|nr:GNAT family N-acetyltransferase [Myxococcaceae bacterium]MCI0670206.1 GNAT family N-acetyltransferase [Myxococcaceae bacterium]